MIDPHWKRVLELYESTSALPPDAAQALLDSSDEDPAIIEQVREILGHVRDGEPDAQSAPEENSEAHFAGLSIARYEVIAHIGRGSNGEVYSGRDRELARLVALKFMSPRLAGTGSSAQRFVREAQAAAALNHPNIVTLHEVITWRSSPVIVMELVEGATLRELCGDPISVPRALHLSEQFMRALAYAHEHGIVHRDFKPENVIVRPDGYVKVLDFGLARQTVVDANQQNISSTAGLPVGTLRYMSPEQCRGEPATPASDVFAAGIVLFEMMTGRHPFEADSPLDTAHAIVWSEPLSLLSLRPAVPASINSLIARMLAKDAHARPSAIEVAEALANEQEHEGTSSRIGPLLEDRAQNEHGRTVRVAILAGAITLALLLAIILLGAFWFSRRTTGTAVASDLQISPLASLLGAERAPYISPDNTRVAFAFTGQKETVSHIYVKDLSDNGLRRLTSGALSDFHPVISPDGTKVAFLRRADGRLRLMVTPLSGGIERQMSELTDILREYAMMSWDGEGRNLLVSDRAKESRPEIAIVQISIETGARRQLTFPPPDESDWMPSVSPDGRMLGFARLRETGRGDLWEIPVEGGGARSLTSSNEVFFCWAWAAGGKDLLISYRREGRFHLWRQPTGGGAQVRVAGLDDRVTALSVAQKGNLMIYGPGNEEDYNVWSYPLPPSKAPARPVIASAAFDGDARYSPDGTRIAFASTRSGYSNIWLCASDGSDVRQLTSLHEGGFTAGSPSWSPDGRWIAFDSRSPRTESSIFVIDVLGGTPRRLTGPGPSDIIPTWSRDSRWIYFGSDRGGGGIQIWRVPASGGAPVQVTRNGGLEMFESADGHWLYYTKRDRNHGFWRMPAGGGEETFVPELQQVTNRYWENSSKGIYFVAPSRTPVLELFHFADSRVSRVSALRVPPAMAHGGLSISPDGREFLYMQDDVAISNLMVVNNFR